MPWKRDEPAVAANYPHSRRSCHHYRRVRRYGFRTRCYEYFESERLDDGQGRGRILPLSLSLFVLHVSILVDAIGESLLDFLPVFLELCIFDFDRFRQACNR